MSIVRARKRRYMEINNQLPYSEGYKYPEKGELLALKKKLDLAGLCDLASDIRDQGHGGHAGGDLPLPC